MWLSLDAASSLYDWASFGLIISAVILVVSTGVIWWTGNIKEEYLRRDVATAHDRAAQANARGEEAKADAAKANERAAESSLKLEQLRREVGPRRLDLDKFAELLRGKPIAKDVTILYSRDDPDSLHLANGIHSGLVRVGWPVHGPEAIAAPEEAHLRALPTAVAAGGHPSGVTIVARSIDIVPSGKDFRGPLKALGDAIGICLGTVGLSQDKSFPPDVFRIVVAPRG